MTYDRVVPDKIPCPNRCKEPDPFFPGDRVPVLASLDPKAYHFLNTGEPYMLRNCPKCLTSWLVII